MTVELEEYDEFYISNAEVGRLSEEVQDKIPVKFTFNLSNTSG